MRPLALTLGEPAGIGPELTLMAWARRQAHGVPAFLLIGDPALLAKRARALNIEAPIAECGAPEAAARFLSALPVMPTPARATAEPGKPNASSAAAALAAIDRAVALVRAGEADAVVTNPIAKSVMAEAGFPFASHTEYLAQLAAEPGHAPPRPVMLIWSDALAVVPVTIHVPLAQVARLISADLIVETGRIVARDMARRFGIARPRLKLCGLNPHAGEAGYLGNEEETIIRPAVDRLKREGLDASGPFPADTLFHAAARATYDVALGMYHDQVLGPVKTLAFERAVNVTLGLPFVRTSPDHGTAFDLAGTGKADPTSLIEALKLARRLADAKAPARVA
jgi:4-hydroxythreonine-4-phosphate dehydrogenase